LIPRSYKADGYRLGQWVLVQRHKNTKGILDVDRQRRLQELPCWTWDTNADRWEEGLRRLVDYVERNGDARVPKSYTVDNYPRGDRQRRLQKLPGWTWTPHADRWEEGFRNLRRYVESHGDARVPLSYAVDGYKLGRWVNKQRANHAKGTLDADRQRRLQDLPGWTWKAR
jgi:helicase associated protein